MRWLITLAVVCLASVSASDVVNAPQITSTQTTRTIENFPEWLQYVSPFQTAIAALLGFVGVIITIIVNGFLARRLEKFKFNQERQGVASALRAELEIISRQIDVYIRNLPMAADITAFPIPILKDVDNFGLIFNALTAKLGYLDNEAVVAVTQTFLRVRSFFTTLAFQEIIKDPGEDSKVYYISNVSESIKEFNIINAEIKSAIAKLKRTGDV